MSAPILWVSKKPVLTLFGLIWIAATSAWGQVPQSPPGEVPATESSLASSNPSAQTTQLSADVQGTGPGFSFLKVVGGLGLVLCLIVVGTFGVRKFAPQYFTRRAPERSLKLLETLPMGERRSIAVIEIDERRLLIGNTPNHITLLAMLGDDSPLRGDQETAAVDPVSRPSTPTFKNLYEFEKNGPNRAKMTIIPPHVRAKMRQLRESLES